MNSKDQKTSMLY